MTASHASPPLERKKPWQRWLMLVVLTLLLSLLLFRVPESPSPDRNFSYRMLLDLSFRPSSSATVTAQALDGPLAPLQNPIYVARSIWRTMVWQLGANLLLAAFVVGAAFRLPSARAAWALGFFAVFGAANTTVAPWIASLLLSCWMMTTEKRTAAVGGGIGLGFLGLTSIAHFFFAIGSLALYFWRRRARKDLGGLVATGFIGGTVGLWLLLELPLPRLGRWLWFGLTGGWTPSLQVLPSATILAFGAAGFTSLVWLALVLARRKSFSADPKTWSVLVLLTWGMASAWKFGALQPTGSPLLFFATVLFGGFVLLPNAPKSASLVFLSGILGTVAAEPALLSDAAGFLNRRLYQSVSEVLHLPSLRDQLRQNFARYAAGLPLPRVRGALAGGPVGVVGEDATAALLNEFRVEPSASLGSNLVRDDAAARSNAAVLLSPESAPFVVQSNDRDSDLLPSLRDGPAQLALHRAYEFVFTEQGLSLWKKKPDTLLAAPKLIQEGTIKFGEKISLPDTTHPCWLELACEPNGFGMLVDQFRPLAEPSLRVADTAGNEVSYGLAWRTARAGFLVQPFFHGDMESWRYRTTGESPAKIRHFIIDSPQSIQWAWRSAFHYRLYESPDFGLSGKTDIAEVFKAQFSAFNRLPVSFSTPFTPVSGLEHQQQAVFMHPNSVLEILTTAQDRTLNGSFGIAEGAYANVDLNVTDGLSFSIEFIPAVGEKIILLQRYLDPVARLDDRGPQPFTLSLPATPGGRILFRTTNLPEKNAGFDWSYWREIKLK